MSGSVPPEACPDRQEDLAAWLVGQIDPGREEALVAHLATCDRCAGEADRLLAVAAVALGADVSPDEVAAPPPADLGDRIVAAVGRERRRVRRGRVAAGVVGAAAVLAAVVLVSRPDDVAPLRGEEVEFAVAPAGVEAAAVVAPEAEGSVVELTATGLDPEVTYALWLTPPGGGYAERVPAGTFRPAADGTVDERLRSPLPAEDVARVWATDPDGDVTLDTKVA